MIKLESGDGGKETASNMVLPNLSLATKEKTPVVLILFSFVLFTNFGKSGYFGARHSFVNGEFRLLLLVHFNL